MQASELTALDRQPYITLETFRDMGIAYSVGAIAEFYRWPVLVTGVIHPHEVFHMAALLGAYLHWRFTWQFATGEVRAAG